MLKRFINSFLMRLRSEVSTDDLIKLGLTVGKNFSRQEKTLIDQSHCWLISIGDNVTLAPRVHILAHDASTKNTLGYTKLGIVDIGNNVFIGASSIILPGVKIGNNVIIGAGSVVSKDISDNSVAVGNPARVICEYQDFVDKRNKEFENSYCFDETFTLRSNELTNEKKEQMIEKMKDTRISYIV